jgi:DNA repair exonuclease SbcCD ATPase subunit
MTFKITKTDNARVMKLADELDDMRTEINDKLDEWRGELSGLLDALNEKREELRGVIEDIQAEKQSEYDDMSEKWLEGDRASPTEDWIAAIEEAQAPVADDFSLELPDDLEFDDEFETLKDEGLPTEPEY